MRDFEPTDHFVSRVMEDIHAYETARRLDMTKKELLLFSRPVRFALSTGGVLLGIANIIRIVSPFIYPALCR